MVNERKLLRLIAASDETAFRCLFDQYKNIVYSLALKFTKCPVSSEEIVQELFMMLWLRRSELKKIDNIKAYLIISTRNLVYKLLRDNAKKYLRVNEEEDLNICDVETHLLEKEYSIVLKKAIKRLPSQQQKVYILVKENGMRREEAASALNLAPDTIKFHLSQAMKSIRAYCSLHLSTAVAIFIKMLTIALQ